MSTLTDRYIHAATRWLPGRTREDVKAELRERIEDTVAARGGADAEREVLEELGDPLRVSVDYAGREPVLIGPRWFFIWLRLVVLLLMIVPPIVAIVTIVASTNDDASLGATIGTAIGALWEVGVQIVFWTTLTFAVLEWTGATPDTGGPWTVDKLPDRGEGSTLGELILTLVLIPTCAALIVWQHVGSPFSSGGERIPLADPGLWRWFLPLVLVTLALELAHALWIHATGWSWPAAVANATITLAFAVPTIIVLTDNALINPDLIAHLGWNAETVAQTLQWTALGVGLVAAWEILDGVIKARRASI